MIRRGFWVAVGAAGGIMAYRRVARVFAPGGRPPGDPPPGGTARPPRPPWGAARETIRFTRDVREGMDEYKARHPGRPGPTLGANTDHTEKDDR